MADLPSQMIADIQAKLKAVADAQAKTQGVTAKDRAQLEAAAKAFDAYVSGMSLAPGESIPEDTLNPLGPATPEAGLTAVIPTL